MTPNLKYKQYTINKLVSDLEGFLVYYNPQLKSWWWINPETKEWRFEFKDSGSLYWYYHWGDNFRMKYSLDDSEFEEMISRYVEHTLQNGVVNTAESFKTNGIAVEHTLQNGVVNTCSKASFSSALVEHTLQNGVVNTLTIKSKLSFFVEHTLQNGVVGTLECRQPYKRFVEDMISKESECTFNVNYTLRHGFENEPR